MTTGVSVNLHTAPADAGDGTILSNLLMFGEVLRRLGLDVGSGNMLDLVRATEFVPIGGNRNDFRLAARALLVHRRSDLELFDEAFQVFWRRPAHGRSMRDLRSMGEERRYRTPRVMPHREDTSDGPPGGDDPDDAGDRQPVVDLQRSFSAREVLRQRDFADYTPAEVSAARVLMSELQWDLGSRRTRRLTWGDGRDVDLRRTMRRSLSYGGEMLDIAHRRRKNKPRPLVLICDVSGSMERYTRMLLHFVHTVAVSGQQLEAFLFATRLTRITRHLEHRGVDRAVSEVARAVPDWAGGTRIGEAIKAFNYRWARRVLRGGAVVLVISDGWDRGRTGPAVPRDGPTAAQLPSPDLAEPAPGIAGIRAADPGDAGGAAVHRRLSSGAQSAQPAGTGGSPEPADGAARAPDGTTQVAHGWRRGERAGGWRDPRRQSGRPVAA